MIKLHELLPIPARRSRTSNRAHALDLTDRALRYCRYVGTLITPTGLANATRMTRVCAKKRLGLFLRRGQLRLCEVFVIPNGTEELYSWIEEGVPLEACKVPTRKRAAEIRTRKTLGSKARRAATWARYYGKPEKRAAVIERATKWNQANLLRRREIDRESKRRARAAA